MIILLGDINEQSYNLLLRIRKYENQNNIQQILPSQIIKLIAEYAQPYKIRPKPKFKNGDSVIINSSRRGFIYGNPVWNNWTIVTKTMPQWYYNYDYGLGGTSEGSALEYSIKLA